MSIEEVAAVTSALPKVSEGESRGNRTWVVSGKTFAWERPFSKADIRRFGDGPVPDGPILAVRVADLGEKEAVLAQHIKGVFTIPHFDGYAAILIQLNAASKRAVREAITDAWLACAPSALGDAYMTTRPRRRG